MTLKHIQKIHDQMGIDPDYAEKRNLNFYSEAESLIKLNNDIDERSLYLLPEAAELWQKMKAVAKKEQVDLLAYSGFRNYEYQRRLIERGLERGMSLDEALRNWAAPGYSEHHTGCALDITTTNCRAGVEDFSKTEAFKWLKQNAGNFGFIMTYPENNPWGFVYEPWHWSCYA